MEIEKPCFVDIGEGLILPIGYRFRPTDEELVVLYLKRKIYSFPLPASIIPEHQVFDTNPWDLPGDLKEKRYFFSKGKEYVKNHGGIVAAGCGYWKQIGEDKEVVSRSKNHDEIVGMKKTSVFCQREHPKRMNSCWIMQLFFLVNYIANISSTESIVAQTGDWVACCIYQQKLIIGKC